MAKISDLMKVSLPVSVTFGDIEVNATWRPATITAEWIGRWAEMTIDQALLETLVSWDLEDDEGPLLITAENLAALPATLKSDLHKGIMGEIFPNLRSGTN